MLATLLQAAAVIGAIGTAYTIPPRGYMRRSDCPEASAVDRLFAETQRLTIEKLEIGRLLERRDVDIEDADKTIAELAVRVETLEREAKRGPVRDPKTGRMMRRVA